MTGSSATLQKAVNRNADMKNVKLEFYSEFEGRVGDLVIIYRDAMRIADLGGYGQQEYFFEPRSDAKKLDALLTKMGL